ncbi:hypothetical protein LUZ60_008078 [Juncus effusus]|nr:hypothetical protein LUZ60_008078 [Juncus effusus]
MPEKKVDISRNSLDSRVVKAKPLGLSIEFGRWFYSGAAMYPPLLSFQLFLAHLCLKLASNPKVANSSQDVSFSASKLETRISTPIHLKSEIPIPDFNSHSSQIRDLYSGFQLPLISNPGFQFRMSTPTHLKSGIAIPDFNSHSSQIRDCNSGFQLPLISTPGLQFRIITIEVPSLSSYLNHKKTSQIKKKNEREEEERSNDVAKASGFRRSTSPILFSAGSNFPLNTSILHLSRPVPLQIIQILGNFMRIWSVYSMYRYVTSKEESIVAFIFTCLVPSAIIFLALQKPWKGRPLPNSQVVPTIVNGGIMALYFILWGKGLLTCGPLLALLGEYAGAVLGVLSATLYGRNVNLFKKVGGLGAMLISYYLLSNGWATRTYSPLYSFGGEGEEKEPVGMKEMIVPLTAGVLSALRRVIARRVSLKSQQKRRLHAITIASATCFLFPVAMWDTILGSASDSIVKFQLPSWAYLSSVLFGIVFIFYIDNLAEERLHIVFSSPRHLMVTGGCIILLEIFYGFDFSLLGFILCASILGFGIYQSTSLERSKRGGPLETQELSNGSFHTDLPVDSLPS